MQEIAEAVLDAEVKVGELTARIPKNERARTDLVDTGVAQTKRSQLQKIGIHEKQAERYEQLAKHPEIVEKAKQEARKRGEVVTRFVNIPLSRFVVRWSWESGRQK